MKRSEMIKLLEERFDAIGLNITSSVLAESVMRMIEDAGMQPPNIKLRALFPNSNLHDDENYWYGCWEPESEE